MSWVEILKENPASTGCSFVPSEPLNLLYVPGLRHTQTVLISRISLWNAKNNKQKINQKQQAPSIVC